MRMDSKRGHESIHVFESAAAKRETNEKVHIEGEVIGRIHSAAFEIEIPFPERRGLLQRGTAIQVAHRHEGGLALLTDDFAVCVDPEHVAVSYVYLGIAHCVGN